MTYYVNYSTDCADSQYNDNDGTELTFTSMYFSTGNRGPATPTPDAPPEPEGVMFYMLCINSSSSGYFSGAIYGGNGAIFEAGDSTTLSKTQYASATYINSITITGGVDATNSNLIVWLQDNATQIQTGYSSTINLTNCTCNKQDETGLTGSYTATINATDGYYLSSVTSTLGTAIINEDKRTAEINITDVTENFTITGIATSVTYRNVELYPNNNGTIDYTKVLLPKAMSDSSKQDTLTQPQLAAVNSGITEEKIQVGTTSENPLVNKDFVNSSIATNTSKFIGTFNNIVDLRNYQGTVTNNDYAFVINKVINSGNPFNSFNAMITYVTPLIEYVVNYDYAFVVNSSDNTKIDVYRYDISKSTIAERWGENEPVATAIDINDFQKNPAYNRYKYTTEQSPAE